MQLEVLNRAGQPQKTIEVADSVFDAEFNNTLVHQVAVAYKAAARAGTHAQKNRSAVRGGGAKPWRQKGIGRARAGTRNSPIFRGGGQTFAASTRDYAQKVNRKSYRAAMRSALSEIRRRGRLVIVGDLNMETPKTKSMAACLNKLQCPAALIVTDAVNDNLYLAARNLPNVDIVTPAMLNPASAVECERIVMTERAIQSIAEWLQ